MKNICSLLIVSLFFSPFAFTQITLNAEDVLSLTGKSFTQEGTLSESLEVSPGMAGADQTWDLAAIPMDSVANITWSFETPDNTPFAANYPEANFVQVFSFDTLGISVSSYTYAKVTDTEFVSLGDVSISSFLTLVDTTFEDFSDTTALFPLTYERAWSEVSTDTIDFFGTTEIIVDSTDYLVDAYGSVVVPGGTFDCLRVRIIDNSIGISSIGGIPTDSTDYSSVSYIWIAKEAFIAATMEGPDGSSSPDFSSATFFTRLASTGTTGSDTTGTDTTVTDTTGMDTTTTPIRPLLEVVEDVQLSPNPAQGELNISFTLPEKMPLNLAIYDLRGRKVHTLVSGVQFPGEYSYSWQGITTQGKSIRPGWYVAVLFSGDRGHAMKFLWRP